MSAKNALVLSDVHYGDLAHLDSFGKTKPSSDDDLKHIAQSIVDLLQKENINIDFIFVLGDLTSRGSPGELQDVYRFLTILRTLLSLDENRVFITYGNHDVDWKVCELQAISDEYRDAYCKAAATLGGIFAPSAAFNHKGPVAGCGIIYLDGIDLISLNSGIECYSGQEIKHGRLGLEQFQWIQNDLQGLLRDDSTKIVILHHHLMNLPYSMPVQDLSSLEEGANAIEILGKNGIDLVLHGHRHHPIAHTTIKTGWKKPITIFCAGSFGVAPKERAGGRLPNTLHTVVITPNSGAKKSLEGFIQSFELNSASEWIPLEPNMAECPLNQTQWFGAEDATRQAPIEIKKILESAGKEIKESNFCRLPHYDSLPLSLRCLLHKDLSRLFQAEASSIGLCITGEYPSNCIATKKG